MPNPLRSALACACAFSVAAAATLAGGAETGACVSPERWLDPATRTTLAGPDLIARLSRRPIVLLGEVHDWAPHHRWQLHTIAALHGREPNMVLAFEAFPRGVQPALDRWVEGAVDGRRFLAESRWGEVWGFDPELYMGLFRFARMHRIPMLAMNVERALVARVGRDGWEAVPEAERQGVTTPRPADPAYVESLAGAFNQHQKRPVDTPFDRAGPEFRRFVAAQQTWDRAMAQSLAAARRAGGDPLVVGVVGSGHLEYGYGIPHQLADLGIGDAAVLLPWEPGQSCADLKADSGAAVADAVFGFATEVAAEAPWRPLLGVLIEAAEDGVRVTQVMGASVAEAAGLRVGDVITAAAGVETGRVADLIAVVRRQAPGTWLPLSVRRAGTDVDVVARFAPRP